MLKRRRSGSFTAAGGSQGTSTRPRSRSKRVLTYAGRGIPAVPRAPRLTQFPQPMVTANLKYAQTFTLTGAAAGVIVEDSWWCNGLFDPYASVGGHQPYGYDTIASMYNHYQVLKATATLYCSPYSSPNIMFGMDIGDDIGFAAATPQDIIESRDDAFQIVVAQQGGKKIKRTFVATERYPGAGAATQGKSLTSGSPADGMFFNVWASTVDQSLVMAATSFVIVIDYTAIFWELKDLPAS